jgi:hypothetical protein
MILACSLHAFIKGPIRGLVMIWAINVEYIKVSRKVAKDDREVTWCLFGEVIRIRLPMKNCIGQQKIDIANAGGLRKGFVDGMGESDELPYVKEVYLFPERCACGINPCLGDASYVTEGCESLFPRSSV